ncbi:MAG: ankyrin repeat domain-containing protein [Ekhidna sp.]|nr:ankyrin repeat domain-containing protein [Ekhidna sp.]
MIRSGEFKGFIQAVMNEDSEAVSYYISLGMDVNFLHPEIMTNPLIEATKVQNLEIVQLLLDAGANPTIVSQLGESALKIAKFSGNKELLNTLKQARKSPFSLHQFFKKRN